MTTPNHDLGVLVVEKDVVVRIEWTGASFHITKSGLRASGPWGIIVFDACGIRVHGAKPA